MTTCIHSNHYLSQKQKGLIDLTNDSLILILMTNTFNFDRDDHSTLADVSSNQIATGNGYTQNSITLNNPVHSEDDVNNRAQTIYDAIDITADGGDLPESNGAIIYDDSTTDDTVIGFVEFDTPITVLSGKTLRFSTIYIRDL